MSASLVGSEMCIRDSPDRSSTPQPVERGHGRAVRPRPLSGGGPTRRGPVSYTHLTLPTICSV
eukprot:13942096-Alexandrium_andersonii.AAC.1